MKYNDCIRFTLRLLPQTNTLLTKESKMKRMAKNALILQILSDYLEQKEKPDNSR